MSGWDSVKKVIGTVAPGLATALGGPLAGQAVSAITSALGLGPTEEEKAIQIISQSPDALLKLKQAEFDFKKVLVDAGIKLDELDVQDRGSARDLAKTKGMIPQIVLSAIYTIGYFGLMFGLLHGDLKVPPDGHDLILGLIAILTAGEAQIMNFWFGSSSGSARKTELAAQVAAA